MLSKNKIKLFNSLQRKKNRDQSQLFLAEGKKCILEIFNSKMKIHTLVATKEWISNNSNIISNTKEVITATKAEIKEISGLQSAGEVVIIAHQIRNIFSVSSINNELSLVLEDIQDPGNMGTIIRTASWFGINNIICSKNSVDIFNPKVVQATMGAICKVNVFYEDIKNLLKQVFSEKKLPIYGTFLEGEDIYKSELQNKGLIVIGNEGSGISESLLPYINHQITIPAFSNNKIESLNVSTATAIVCSEFKRSSII